MAKDISNKIFSVEKLRRWTKKIHQKVIDSEALRDIDAKYVSSRGLTRSDILDKLENFQRCCEFLEIGKSGNDYVLSDANYCKNESFCPQCAAHVQTRRRARYSNPILNAAKKCESGELVPYMITLTIKSGDSLAERLDALNGARRTMRRMGQRRRKNGRSGGEFGKIDAALCAIEAKRGENSGQWHVHNHILAFCSEELDYAVYDRSKMFLLKKKYGEKIPPPALQKAELPDCRQIFAGSIVKTSKISREWIAATGGESIDIQCDRLKHVPSSARGQRRAEYRRMNFADSIYEQSREIFKYMTKLDKNESSDIIEIMDAMYNRRKFDAYGSFRSIGLDDYERVESEEQYIMKYSAELEQYVASGAGKIRDIEKNEIAETARKKSGVALGDYRRRRRYLIDHADMIGNQLSIQLDAAKIWYRSKISAIWTDYKNYITRRDRTRYAGCDKYSPLIALAGKYLPGSSSKTIYDLAF
jgi:hypothetical protein